MNNNYELISSSAYSESYYYYVVFAINDRRLAINIKNVVEIISIQDIESIGAMPENIIGMFNYNGLMVKVVDLHGFLNEQRKKYALTDKLIIVMVEGNCFAVHTDNVIDIVQFKTNLIQDVPFNLENSIVDEIYKEDSETISILNLDSLDKITNSQQKSGKFDYSELFPTDEKSKQVLQYRAQLNKDLTDSFAISENINLIHQYILFTLDGFNYYLDLKYVKEFVSLKRFNITKLPYTQDYIRGIINLKGNFLVVVDLKRFINKGGTNSEKESHELIIVESKNFDIAFLVDDIKYIRDLKNIKRKITNQSNSPYIYSEFIEDNVLYSILNFEKIIADERLYINLE